MNFFKKKQKQKQKPKNSEELLKKWEYNLLFTLIILLVLATILKLNLSLTKILNIIVQ